MEIRRADPEDAEALTALRLSFAGLAPSDPAPPDPAPPDPAPSDLAGATLDHFRRHLARRDSFLSWVAEADGRVVATGSLILFPRLPNPRNLSGLEGYVSNFYTDPAHRRRGAATGILAALVAEARGLGVGRCWLYSTDEAHGLYERAGFRPRSRREAEMELVPP